MVDVVTKDVTDKVQRSYKKYIDQIKYIRNKERDFTEEWIKSRSDYNNNVLYPKLIEYKIVSKIEIDEHNEHILRAEPTQEFIDFYNKQRDGMNAYLLGNYPKFYYNKVFHKYLMANMIARYIGLDDEDFLNLTDTDGAKLLLLFEMGILIYQGRNSDIYLESGLKKIEAMQERRKFREQIMKK